MWEEILPPYHPPTRPSKKIIHPHAGRKFLSVRSLRERICRQVFLTHDGCWIASALSTLSTLTSFQRVCVKASPAARARSRQLEFPSLYTSLVRLVIIFLLRTLSRDGRLCNPRSFRRETTVSPERTNRLDWKTTVRARRLQGRILDRFSSPS